MIDAGTKRKRKTRAKAAEAASKMTASSVIGLFLPAITEIFKLGLFTDEVVQNGLTFAEALVASDCSTNFACGIGSFLTEVNATCSGHAMENPLDSSIQALWRHWLCSVGEKNDAGLLFSIRPAVQTLFKQWQRRDMLAWSTSELAMLAADYDECPATLTFFFGLVSPSETMMRHFVSSLPLDAASSAATVAVLNAFTAALSEGVADVRTEKYRALIGQVSDRLENEQFAEPAAADSTVAGEVEQEQDQEQDNVEDAIAVPAEEMAEEEEEEEEDAVEMAADEEEEAKEDANESVIAEED